MKEALTKTVLNQIFEYREGILYWKKKTSIAICIGDKAGNIGRDGYARLRLFTKEYKVHRIIWVMFHGELPDSDQIDHIDGNRLNNRIDNLRRCSNRQNSYNRSKNRNNTSGYKGVYYYKAGDRRKPFSASIRVNGKTKCLGYFETAEDASAAYRTAAELYHGQFAKV